MFYVCIRDVMDVFSVCMVRCICSYMGSVSFVVQMLYVLCVSCGSPQCCILHDLQFVNAG